MNKGKIVLGILAGVAVGVAAGILLAPDKGSSTRKKISKKGQKYAEELEQRFSDFIRNIAKKFEIMKETAGSMPGNEKTKIDNAIKEVNGALK